MGDQKVTHASQLPTQLMVEGTDRFRSLHHGRLSDGYRGSLPCAYITVDNHLARLSSLTEFLTHTNNCLESKRDKPICPDAFRPPVLNLPSMKGLTMSFHTRHPQTTRKTTTTPVCFLTMSPFKPISSIDILTRYVGQPCTFQGIRRLWARQDLWGWV